jgi:hypothetical protein
MRATRRGRSDHPRRNGRGRQEEGRGGRGGFCRPILNTNMRFNLSWNWNLIFNLIKLRFNSNFKLRGRKGVRVPIEQQVRAFGFE